MFSTRVHRRVTALGTALGATVESVEPSPALACGLRGKLGLVLTLCHRDPTLSLLTLIQLGSTQLTTQSRQVLLIQGICSVKKRKVASYEGGAS